VRLLSVRCGEIMATPSRMGGWVVGPTRMGSTGEIRMPTLNWRL